MLFLAHRILDHNLNDEARLHLLDSLQEKGMSPLIRSTRLNCFKLALSNSLQAREMEQHISLYTIEEERTAYVSGDLFCFEDHVCFLVFGDMEYGPGEIRAGIVYERITKEPLRKLDAFCDQINSSLAGDGKDGSGEDGLMSLAAWRQDQPAFHQGFTQFLSQQDTDSLYAVRRKESAHERVRAAELLDDARARHFLHQAKEAYDEGYALRLGEDGLVLPPEVSVSMLMDVGLLKREVLVSCRRTGHTLFSLPSADALAVITIGEARCTECGARIADEKIEEVMAPTQLASGLLDDGAWLLNRLHSMLRELGVAESEIAVEPPSGDGEARMMVNVCGEPFLLVLRDGDLTPAFARRAIDMKLITKARHLVVVVTGNIQKDGRLILLNFSRRLTRGGSDFELVIAEGANAAASELQNAFARVSQKALTENLCELDAALGVSVTRFLSARFHLLRAAREAEKPKTLPAVMPGTSLQINGHNIPLMDLAQLNFDDKKGDQNIGPTQPTGQTG